MFRKSNKNCFILYIIMLRHLHSLVATTFFFCTQLYRFYYWHQNSKKCFRQNFNICASPLGMLSMFNRTALTTSWTIMRIFILVCSTVCFWHYKHYRAKAQSETHCQQQTATTERSLKFGQIVRTSLFYSTVWLFS